MMEYELINPSDPYTFFAKSREVAALAVWSLSPAYGAKSKDESEENSVPICLFWKEGETEKWYKDNFGRTVKEGIAACVSDVADALDSFMFGEFKDRDRYQAALDAIDDPAKKENFKRVWLEDISSLNNIGEAAHEMARKLRASKEKSAKHQVER